MEITALLDGLAKQGITGLVCAGLIWLLKYMNESFNKRYEEMRKQLEDRYTEDRRRSEDALAKLGGEFRQTVEANTQAVTKLCTLVENMEAVHCDNDHEQPRRAR
jgi:hypothetical protein